MKKDLVVALVIILIVFVAMFAVGKERVPLPLTPSHPFRPAETSAIAPGVAGKVVMRVNGEPITEDEFDAAYGALPPEMQQQFANPQGKQALAEELIRMKILEQEARKKGLDRDAKVASQISLEQSQALANAAVQQLVTKPSEAAVRKFYDANKRGLETLDLYGVIIAYQGAAVPPRSGQPLTEQQAMAKGAQVAQLLQNGADVAQLAKQYSDDPASASRGGLIGAVAPGALPEELDQRVMAMQPGEIIGPIPSRIGVCVFKAGQRRAQPLEGELRQRIEQSVRQQETIRKVDQLRKFAKVDMDPKFFPALKTPPKLPAAR